MIGTDEKSWGKGSGKYLTVVTDHASGKIAWITEGRSQDTVGAFFDALGPERSAQLTHVSADGAEWIRDVARAPQAQVNALITRARGFRSAAALIAMANYVHGGLCPDSPY
jgi:transposase